MPLAGCAIFTGAPVALTAQAGADVVVAAGGYAEVCSIGGVDTVLASNNPGPLLPVVFGGMTIALGAAAPTALLIALFLGGVIQTVLTVSTTVLVANANLMIPIAIVGAGSQTGWNAGYSPNLRVNPTTNGVTVRANGLSAAVTLFPSAG